MNHIWQIILLAKKVFIRLDQELEAEPDLTSLSTSTDLGDMFYVQTVKMYKEDIEEFRVKVAETVANCHEKLYEPPTDSDPNAIVFGPWNDKYDDLRQKLLTGKAPTVVISSNSSSEENSMVRTGLSWVQKDSLRMFSKSPI